MNIKLDFLGPFGVRGGRPSMRVHEIHETGFCSLEELEDDSLDGRV